MKIVAAKKTALDDAVDLALELLNAEDTVKTMDDRLKYADKFGKLTRTILKIGKSKELLSYNDINDFYASTLGRKHSAGELSREKAIEAFNVFLKDVVDWSCYLSLSGILGLPKGYVLGECAVVNFDDLPKSLKEEIADSWKHKFELNKGRLHGESFDSFQKREEKETYLGCTVSTIGFDKALETARRIGTQAISIYKIVYEWELPQIREIWASSKKLSGGTPEESVGQVSFPHFPTPNLEHYIEVLTKMVRAKTKCDIERNLILATEMRGLVQREMPNELKFLLAMMSMEAALSGGSGPIAWKLRERIALLLGDDPNWVHIYLKKGLTETVSADEVLHNRIGARASLADKVDEWYELRSGFAHGGTRLEDKLTDQDVEQASMIAKFLVQIILQLYEQQGIRTVGKKTEREKESLDWLLESVRFNQPLPLK